MKPKYKININLTMQVKQKVGEDRQNRQKKKKKEKVEYVYRYRKYIIQVSMKQKFRNTEIQSDLLNTTETALYSQFVGYLKSRRKKNMPSSIQLQYKDIYSALHQSNLATRRIRESIQSRTLAGRFSGSQFLSQDTGFSAHQEKVRHQSLGEGTPNDHFDQDNLQDRILMEESYQVQLERQISSSKAQLRTYTSKINEVKNQIKIVEQQERKFTEVYHLATNIMQLTDHHEITNTKNYTQMLQQQEQRLQKLKKQHKKTKQQLTDTQNLYHLHKKEHQTKYKILLRCSHSSQPISYQKAENDKKQIKNLRKFMEYVEKVLDLLQLQEPNFQTIRQEMCTRVPTRKIICELLGQDLREWIRVVDAFQAKYGMRLESTDRIIVRLFQHMKLSNDELQKRVFQHRQLLQAYEQQLQHLKQKEPQQHPEMANMDPQLQFPGIHRQQIQDNSIALIKIMQSTNSLLLKFKCIFKLFTRMFAQKKRQSNDHFQKLEDLIEKKLVFEDGLLELTTVQDLNQEINVSELMDLLTRRITCVKQQYVRELIAIVFNDLRVALMCRRGMIWDCAGEHVGQNLDSLIDILRIIQKECYYIFNLKLMESLKFLGQCFSCSFKFGPSVCSSKNLSSRRFNILSSQLELPFGLFQKATNLQYNFDDDQVEENASESRKSRDLALQKNDDKQKIELWGEEERKNPSVMIRKLLTLRNETSRKFKLLDLNFIPKRYTQRSTKSMANVEPSQIFEGKNTKEGSKKGRIFSKNINQEPKSLKNMGIQQADLNQGHKVAKSQRKLKENNFVFAEF